MNRALPADQPTVDVSFVMPCYNEAENVDYSIPRFINAFRQAGHRLQLVAVDNGSRDGTRAKLDALASAWPELVIGHVDVNIGLGKGILTGMSLATAPWIGVVAADGQVDAEDAVRLYEAVAATNGNVIGKVRRRFRMDGFLRKVVSVSYNLMANALWPGLGSWDVNGNPRILPRDVLDGMRLESTNWFIDPEMLIKAKAMGVRVLELNVFARMRGNGLSHVRAITCWEFFRYLILFRIRGVPHDVRNWRAVAASEAGAVPDGRTRRVPA